MCATARPRLFTVSGLSSESRVSGLWPAAVAGVCGWRLAFEAWPRLARDVSSSAQRVVCGEAAGSDGVSTIPRGRGRRGGAVALPRWRFASGWGRPRRRQRRCNLLTSESRGGAGDRGDGDTDSASGTDDHHGARACVKQAGAIYGGRLRTSSCRNS